MIGLGTIINAAGIASGGLVGHFTSKIFRREQQEAVTKACGVSVLFISTAGAMEGMLKIHDGSVASGKTIRAANMLPAVLLAVIAAYLPIGF